MTNTEAREILIRAGIRHKKMAEEVKINKFWVSQWLCGSRLFDPERQKRVDEYLEKVKTFLLANKD